MNGQLSAGRILLSDRREKMLQRLALNFKTSARKKIQSRSTVVEISRSRSLFEALKTLLFEKYVPKSKKFCERLKSINFYRDMCDNSPQFY